MAIVLVLIGCRQMHIDSPALVYALCLILTVAVSAVSYELHESKFIRIKVRYSTVVSGENALAANGWATGGGEIRERKTRPVAGDRGRHDGRDA